MNDPVPPPVRWLSQRLASYYFAYYIALGVQMPFWPVWLAARGLDAAAIGDLVTASIAARVLFTPTVATLADRLGERKRIIVILSVIAAASFVLFQWTVSFAAVLAVSLVFFPAWSCGVPLCDSMTMMAAYRHGLDYGRVRLWGSIAFIVASLLGGYLLAGRTTELIYWLLLGSTALLTATALWQPDMRTARPAGEARSPFRVLLGDRRFLLFLLANALVQSSHGLYYVAGTLHWQSAGIADNVIGALWAVGVVAEVLLFLFGARLVRRIDPVYLIAIGGLGGILRWSVTASSDAVAVLAVIQVLHAATFAAAHLGAMHYIARAVPPSASATAQSLYSALAMGLGTGLATFASGRLYEAFGGHAYYAMALLAGLGAVAAFVLQDRVRSGRRC